MAKYCWLAFILFASTSGFCQDISLQQADSIILLLKEDRPKPERVDLLLNLAQYHIFKPGENREDFDSAMVFIKEAKEMIGQGEFSASLGYLRLTESYLTKEEGQKVEGKRLAEDAIRILESTDSSYYLGRAYYELSMYYNYLDSIEVKRRISLVEQSIEAFQKAGTLLEKARSLEMLGDIYITTGDMNKRIEILKDALLTYESIGHRSLQGVYVLLGESYEMNDDHGQALFYELKALRLAQVSGLRSMQLCQIDYSLGMLYHKVNMCDRELKYLREALQVAIENNDEITQGQVMAALSSAYYDLNQPGESLKVLDSLPKQYRAMDNATTKAFVAAGYLKSYMKLQQYSLARPYCDTMLAIVESKKLFLEYQTSSAYRTAATYFILIKQYNKARTYLNKSNQIAVRTKNAFALIQGHQLSYKLDSAEGNFAPAFTHLHSFKLKMDSVNGERKTRQFQVIAVEYELGMKEDSIKLKDKDILLLTQQNSLAQANLKQTNFVKNVTLAGIIVAIFITGLLYRQYRSKQKNNLIITQQNWQLQHYLEEKEWLLKEIHHRVKNNLQMVMSLLNSQSAFISNQPALTAIHDSQHRIHAMSLIHQKLYNADNLSTINIASYIRELVSYLNDSFDAGRHIRFEFSVESLEMDVSQAIPVGLILNEAITNSLKYAFPDERVGTISVSLSLVSSTQCQLLISDNGIGIPSSMANKKNGSLGMSLMEGLSEDLAGSFSIERERGTLIKISFPLGVGPMRPKP